MADSKILPCPFCGSDQVAVRGARPTAGCPRVQCSHCGARGPEWLSLFFGVDVLAPADEEQAAVVEAWNRVPRLEDSLGRLANILKRAIAQERSAMAEPLSAEDAQMLEEIKASVLGTEVRRG